MDGFMALQITNPEGEFGSSAFSIPTELELHQFHLSVRLEFRPKDLIS